MTVFNTSLNQTAFLLLFIITGYVLSKCKFLPEQTAGILSKLESLLFVPALVLNTFMNHFTTETFHTAWKLLAFSLVLAFIMMALSLLCVRFCSKDKYVRNIYTYGLCFSNFGFMGNAVVSALFPDIFLDYLIFTLPLWVLIYIWGVPVLLLGDSDHKPTLRERLKNFSNPMFVCTILGMLLGLSSLTIPSFLSNAIATAGSCMSPIAMLLTGMVISQYRLKEILKIKSVYLVTTLRLLVFPLLFISILLLVKVPNVFSICAICSLAMPLGLNTIIIPSSIGKDTKVAASMALVSHILSCFTIPVIFMIFESIPK